jgi:hypothetical protein
MKKRLAILAMGATLASMLAVANPADAHCTSPSVCLPATAAGAFVFNFASAVGAAAGEDQDWCVGGLPLCDSHLWSIVVGTASCSATEVTISSGSIALTFHAPSNGIITSVTGVPGIGSAPAVGFVQTFDECSGVVAFAGTAL